MAASGSPPASAGSWNSAQPAMPRVSDGLVTAVKVLIVLQLPVPFLINALRLRYASQLEGATAAADIATTEMLLGLLVIAYLFLLLLPAGVCWCLWQARSHRRLQSLRPQAAFRTTPGWGVGSWFVPVANLWVPFRAVADLWRNSAPPGASGPEPTPPDVGRWWTLFVGVPVGLLVLSFVVGFVLAAGGNAPAEATLIRADTMVNLLTSVSWVAAAWVVIRLVGGIHGRIRALEERTP